MHAGRVTRGCGRALARELLHVDLTLERFVGSHSHAATAAVAPLIAPGVVEADDALGRVGVVPGFERLDVNLMAAGESRAAPVTSIHETVGVWLEPGVVPGGADDRAAVLQHGRPRARCGRPMVAADQPSLLQRLADAQATGASVIRRVRAAEPVSYRRLVVQLDREVLVFNSIHP